MLLISISVFTELILKIGLRQEIDVVSLQLINLG